MLVLEKVDVGSQGFLFDRKINLSCNGTLLFILTSALERELNRDSLSNTNKIDKSAEMGKIKIKINVFVLQVFCFSS